MNLLPDKNNNPQNPFCDKMKRLSIFILLMLTINSLSAMVNIDGSNIEPRDSVTVNLKSDNVISRNLFVEFGGPSFGIGIGYDQRFKPESALGFRAGIAFTNGTAENGSWSKPNIGLKEHIEVDFKGVTLPFEVNGILGNRASKFELGVGATPCILDRAEWENNSFTKQGVKLNIFGTLNIGYRLQRKSGFFLRAGITFLLGNLKCSPMDGLFLIPNLSLGYTIR